MKDFYPLLIVAGLVLGAGCATDYEATSERGEIPARAHPSDQVRYEQAKPEELAAIDSFKLHAEALVAESTPFLSLIETEAQIPENYRGNILQVRSERSTMGLEPTAWLVVYSDESGTGQPLEVRFENGKFVSSNKLLNAPQPVSDKNEKLDMTRVKIDSTQALDRAIEESGKGKDLIHSSSLRLDTRDGQPVWMVHLWGKDGNTEVDLGETVISAETGKKVGEGKQ